ncbi:hypothetical protein J4E00_07050 [Siccationidurans soli]|uniref:Uncharacterized protein n=1 Tax=Hymenobacter negativus TaxID=2795026 RepID=A0ABS3QC38_9BACT|nr:hypothetical protein [Hymenobacter negativus]
MCLTRDPRYAAFYAFEFPCFYFNQESYTVSDYDNHKQWRFATPEEAVDFAARHLVKVPLSAEYTVPLTRATLRTLTLDWPASTAVVELQSDEDTLLICLSGVTGCTTTQGMPDKVYTVLSVEYDNHHVWLWLHNGDHIRIAATAMEIKTAGQLAASEGL